MLRIALAAAAIILLSACGVEPETKVSETAAAFIRLPSGGSDMSAAYLSVTSEIDDRLISAAVEGVERVELHTVLEEDGVMKMRQVTGYSVKAGEPLVLKPGGNHLMLFGLERTLSEGETRKVTLTFESGATKVVDVPVQSMSAASRHSQH